MLVIFLLFANSLVFRTCADSPFCVRHRYPNESQNGNWTLQSDGFIENNIFKVSVNDNLINNPLQLIIKYHQLNGLHFRFQPEKPEPHHDRYDIINEETVINQKELSLLQNLILSQSETEYILIGENLDVRINKQTVSITVTDNSGIKTIINPDNAAFFEANVERGNPRFQERFNPKTFLNVTDYFKNGPQAVGISFQFEGENIRLSGLPPHTLRMSLSSTTDTDPIRFFNVDHYNYTIGSVESLYGSIELLHVHSPKDIVSLFWVNPSETWVDLTTSENSAKSRFLSESGFLEFFLLFGSKIEVLDHFTRLVGKPSFIPSAFFGFQQCRFSYESQAEIMEVSSKFDDFNIPHDVMWMDYLYTDEKKYFTWDANVYPDPAAFLKYFADNKRYVVAITDPHFKVDEDYFIYQEIRDHHYYIDNSNGSPMIGECWPGNSLYPSFVSSNVREWYETLYRYDRWIHSQPNLFPWNDMNEMSIFGDLPDNTVAKDALHIGEYEDREIHNLYGHLMVSATFGGLQKRDELKNKRPFVLTRSYFAGTQKYSAVWTGDNAATWDHLKNSIIKLMTLGLSGMPYVGADVTGFAEAEGMPDDKINGRWYQVAAWAYPFFRVHGDMNSKRRELYEWKGGESYGIAKDAIIARYQHFPYWYYLAWKANQTGIPIIRPLWLEFDDPDLIDVDDKFMLGDKMLIVPFLDEKDQLIEFDLNVKLIWYQYDNLQRIDGNHFNIPFNQGRTAVFAKGGSIIPVKYTIRKSTELMFHDPFTFIICLDENNAATGELYIDDGTTIGFMNDAFLHYSINFSSNILSYQRIAGDDFGSYLSDYKGEIGGFKIAGLKNAPSKLIVSKSNRELQISWVDNVLLVNNAHLPVKENWEILLNFDE